jgi:hypothetical protein
MVQIIDGIFIRIKHFIWTGASFLIDPAFWTDHSGTWNELIKRKSMSPFSGLDNQYKLALPIA